MRALKKFLANTSVKHFSKNEVLVHQGIDTEYTYIVKSGVVSCYDISLDGSQQLIYLVSQDEIFPFSHILGQDKTPQFFYGAFSDVEVYEVGRLRFTQFLNSHPDSSLRVFRELAVKINDLYFRINASGKPRAREKILHTLAFIADRFRSRKTKSGEIELSLTLTHQDIASLVGLTRETTTTTLKQLKEERIIYYNSKCFRVRRDLIEKALWG